MTLGPVTRDGDVFRFEVQWATEVFEPSADAGAIFTVRFELDCGGVTQLVEAETIVHICLEPDGGLTFASSGEECRACAIIAEMAPTPIIPSERPDVLPLQQGLELFLRAVARAPNAVVLLAEHDQGADNTRYVWSATAGRVTAVEDDIVVWELPSNEAVEAVQVVVQTDNAVAIATYRHGGGM